MKGATENKVVMKTDVAGVPLCGHLIWYTVSEIAITQEELRDKFRRAGVNEEYLPPRIRPVDAYRKATGTVQCTVETPEEAKKTGILERRYRFEEVLSDPRHVVRHLVRVDVDARAVELRMEELAEVVYDRKVEGLQVRHLNWDPKADELVEEAIGRFKLLRTHYDADAVRRTLRRILDGMSPTLFKDSGGFYFVPVKYSVEFDAFKRLLGELEMKHGTLPVVDTEDARDLVRQMFEHQVREAVARLSEMLKRPESELEKVQVVQGLQVAKTMLAQIREYEELLRQDLEGLAAEAEIIRRQMASLLQKYAGTPRIEEPAIAV